MGGGGVQDLSLDGIKIIYSWSCGHRWLSAACILVRNVISLIKNMLHQSSRWNFIRPLNEPQKTTKFENRRSPNVLQHVPVLVGRPRLKV